MKNINKSGVEQEDEVESEWVVEGILNEMPWEDIERLAVFATRNQLINSKSWYKNQLNTQSQELANKLAHWSTNVLGLGRLGADNTLKYAVNQWKMNLILNDVEFRETLK